MPSTEDLKERIEALEAKQEEDRKEITALRLWKAEMTGRTAGWAAAAAGIGALLGPLAMKLLGMISVGGGGGAH